MVLAQPIVGLSVFDKNTVLKALPLEAASQSIGRLDDLSHGPGVAAAEIAARRKAQSLKEGAAQASSRHRFRFKFCYV